MTTARIYAAFHDSAYVFVDASRDVAVTWNGSLTFIVYTTPGLVAVDQWQARGVVADRWAAREEVERWLELHA